MTDEEIKVIKDFVKQRLSLDPEWWTDFLIGAALAEFSCGSYSITETEK